MQLTELLPDSEEHKQMYYRVNTVSDAYGTIQSQQW